MTSQAGFCFKSDQSLWPQLVQNFSSSWTGIPQTGQVWGASGSAAATGDKTYTIGICQLVQHNALDAATKGFKDALTEKLGDKVKFDEQNAAGDSATCATICNQFVSSKVDLIMANATPALQAATAATNSIPILGTSVTDYGTVHRRLEGHHWHQRHRHR